LECPSELIGLEVHNEIDIGGQAEVTVQDDCESTHSDITSATGVESLENRKKERH
jgi:hypothetical protein